MSVGNGMEGKGNKTCTLECLWINQSPNDGCTFATMRANDGADMGADFSASSSQTSDFWYFPSSCGSNPVLGIFQMCPVYLFIARVIHKHYHNEKGKPRVSILVNAPELFIICHIL